MTTTISVKKGLQTDGMKCPEATVCIVGDLSTLPYSQLQAKLGAEVSEAYYKRAVLDVVDKEPTTEHSIVLTGYCQLLHLSSTAKVARDECLGKPKEVFSFLKKAKSGPKMNILLLMGRETLLPAVSACARLFPMFSMKTGKPKDVQVDIEVLNEKMSAEDVSMLQSLVQSVRNTASLVDMPANILTTDAFVQHAMDYAKEMNLKTTLIQGEDLNKQGFGGLYHVGKTSLHPPALLVLHYSPATVPQSVQNIVLVGKGIVFDTGGMQIKTKTGMPGMKRDMGGAAGVFGAFQVLVASGFQHNLCCVLCLAENMIGPKATRPDDVVTLLSGKTCEINNTDAEGRLVLADGVYYAKQTLKADTIVNMCTLTGAQTSATGHQHSAILCNNGALQGEAIAAGQRSGDMCHAMPFAPNLYLPDLKSQIADMKNANMGKPQGPPSAVAGFFIGAQIGFHSPDWLHIDMAGLVQENERATGYGVSLLTQLFGKYTNVPMLKH